MYETGTPDCSRHRRLRAATTNSSTAPSTWNGSTGWTKRWSAGCATCATRSSARSSRLRTAKDRIESARDAIAAEEQALASARKAVQDRQPTLVADPRRARDALAKISDPEEELDGDVAAIQAEHRREARRLRLGAAAGRARSSAATAAA